MVPWAAVIILLLKELVMVVGGIAMYKHGKYGGFDQKSTLTFSIFYPILLYGVNMSLNFHKNNFRR